ncbi:tat pathway signal sequence [Mycolicibacterium cosmeticum]|nr:tat pathway signal sequence [Mycolicibacterium cosmeticum]TLH65969.1 tat pathway signal sequence [Mycolicibacterium cosmeticum]
MVATLVALTGLLAPSARAACTDATCDLRARIAAADSYLTGRPGVIGYVLRDRSTGLRYANAAADSMIWTASTIKLAMVVDLLTRERAGALRLSAADRQLMVAMLRDSDNDAADTLWSRYGGPDHRAFNADFPRYGMTSLAPQPGFGDIFPYWGFQKATANDLDRLMNYILGQMNSADAAAIAGEMQRVAPDQQWGVWGAGPAMSPGNKNGWSQEQGGWVINSVGFAGPGQRFTLAIMNALGGESGYDDGVATTTRLSQILLG